MTTVGSACGGTRIDLCLLAGARNEFSLQLLKDGDPWDLTGATVTAQARKQAEDADPPALTCTVTPVDEATGIYAFAWDGEEVRTLLAGAASWSGSWDVDVVEAGQTLSSDTPAYGNVRAEMDVTR